MDNTWQDWWTSTTNEDTHMMDDSEKADYAMGKANKIMLYCVAGGSVAGGFSGPASDLDIRGIYIDSMSEALSIKPPKDRVQGMMAEHGVDYQFFEIRKYVKLLINSNLNMLDWACSDVKYKDQLGARLRDLARKSLSKKIGGHARGWSQQIYHKGGVEDWTSPKKNIYALRPLITYIYMLRQGEYTPNIFHALHEQSTTLYAHINLLAELHKAGDTVNNELQSATKEFYANLYKQTKVEEENRTWLPEKPTKEMEDEANKFLAYFYSKFWGIHL